MGQRLFLVLSPARRCAGRVDHCMCGRVYCHTCRIGRFEALQNTCHSVLIALYGVRGGGPAPRVAWYGEANELR